MRRLKNKFAVIRLAAICAAVIYGSYDKRLNAQDKTGVDVYSNLYLSGNTVLGNSFEELIIGYHLKESFVAAGFIHAGQNNVFRGGTLNYLHVKAYDDSLQLVQSLQAGFLSGPFGGSDQAEFLFSLGVELRQWFGRSRITFCGIGVKVMNIGNYGLDLWGGITIGMSF